VFRVILPAAALDVPEIEPSAPGSGGSPMGRRGHVLVVDDDPIVGSTLRRVLADEHDVTLATNGRHALELLSGGQKFDVMLCDLMMPEMTGIDLYQELSRTIPGAVERMVFITGGAFTPTARAFLDEVPNQRLEKPFAVQNLRALVRGFVR